MLTNKKLLIFDLDGTLIDSVGVWNKVDCEIIQKIRRDGKTELENVQKSRDDALMRYREEKDPYLAYYGWLKEKYSAIESAEKIGEMRKAVAKSMVEKEVDYKPFAAEAVKALKTRGFTLVIASTTRRINLEAYKSVNRNIVSKARLEDYFSAIYTHEDVENIKPAPDIHLRLMREFNVLPSECLVFEDSLVGVMAAKNAGIEVCAVYDEHSDGDREKISFLADYKIHDFSELSKLIKVR